MATRNQFGLLRERRFGPFFATQALGAFNDNVFKNALTILVTFGVMELTPDQVNFYVNLAAGLFILPFFLFSATSGQLSEKFDKAQLIRFVKLFEIGIMVLAIAGFQTQSVPLLLFALFLMGLHSTLFGPAKYAILPQHLHEDELVGGNAWVETGTFIAILLGTILGGFLIARSGGTWLISATLLAVAVAGYFASRSIPAAPPLAPELKINWNPLTETWRNFQFMRGNRTVLLSVLGISWFWFFGATLLAQIPNYTKLILGGDESVATLVLTMFALGVGLGSLLCERMSGHKVEIGLVPFGSIGLTLFGADLYFARPEAATALAVGAGDFVRHAGNARVLTDLFLLGVFGGFYTVPLYALIQTRSEPTHRARVIAGNNILNALFMVGSAVLSILLFKAGLTIPQLLLAAALMNAVVAIYIYTLVPEFLMRFLVWIVINVLYRIRHEGLENIPDEGPCVVVCNHVSFIDALILGGTVRRPIRFVMYHKIFRIPVLSFIFRTARAIPIAPAKENEALMNRAMDEIARELAEGHVVGIFPEGGLTPDGKVQEFRSGIERIIQRTPVPVVPVALRGLWRSMWSRRYKRLGVVMMPRRLRARIELIIAPPVAAGDVSAAGLEAKVRELRSSFA